MPKFSVYAEYLPREHFTDWIEREKIWTTLKIQENLENSGKFEELWKTLENFGKFGKFGKIHYFWSDEQSTFKMVVCDDNSVF